MIRMRTMIHNGKDLVRLDLSNQHLETLDASVMKDESLELLSVGFNKLKALPETIGRLKLTK